MEPGNSRCTPSVSGCLWIAAGSLCRQAWKQRMLSAGLSAVHHLGMSCIFSSPCVELANDLSQWTGLNCSTQNGGGHQCSLFLSVWEVGTRSPEVPEKLFGIQNLLYNGFILLLPQTYSHLLFTNRIWYCEISLITVHHAAWKSKLRNT